MGRPAEEIVHLRGADLSTWNLVLQGQKEVTEELSLRNRSGQEVPVMISSFALRDDRGIPQGGAIIIRDLTPVKRLETERRHLVNMFAHDLKTPVVGIAGLIRRLIQGKLGPVAAPQMAYLQTVDHELERLEKLITRFLEFARLDLRIMTPQPEVLNVLEECRQVLTLLQPLAEAKEITLETDFAPELPALKADPLLFRRVLQNLLENAIKYSPGRSQVGWRSGWRTRPSGLPFTIRGRGSPRLIWPISSKSSTGGSGRGIPRASDWGWPRSSGSLTPTAAASGWTRPPAAAAPSGLPFPWKRKFLRILPAHKSLRRGWPQSADGLHHQPDGTGIRVSGGAAFCIVSDGDSATSGAIRQAGCLGSDPEPNRDRAGLMKGESFFGKKPQTCLDHAGIVEHPLMLGNFRHRLV